MTDNDKPNGDESRENKNGGSHNPVGIRKRTLVVSILVISVIVSSLVTASIFSSSIFTTYSTRSLTGSTHFSDFIAPIETQAQKQKCNVQAIQTLFSINPITYPIQGSTLREAGSQFPARFDGFAKETRSGEPQLSQVGLVPSLAELQAGARIGCLTSLTIPIEIEGPVWANVGSLCAPIQSEWSRFMRETDAHEQEHVKLIQKDFRDFGKQLVGKTLAEVRASVTKLETKLQDKHDVLDNKAHKDRNLDLNLSYDSLPECICGNVQTDSNCGKCGNSCSNSPNPIGSTCQIGPSGSTCQCPEGQVNVNGKCGPPICPAGSRANVLMSSLQQQQEEVVCQCIDPNQEPVNGQCVDKCPPGSTRDSSGLCQCTNTNQEIVNGQCVDKCPQGHSRDSSGQCKFCPSGSIKDSSGLCLGCPSGQFLDSSATSCVASCGPNELPALGPVIIEGIQYHQCLPCESGQTVCGPSSHPAGNIEPTCVDLRHTYFHCGACGNLCREPPLFGFGSCDNGVCNVGCTPGMVECPHTGDPFGRNVCVFLDSDESHCGACGNACPPGLVCLGGGKCGQCPRSC